ncbi:hypothetical protein HanXRQr2_Chr16g0767231 [Helianthus annuus]|uniref:Uncharacterized protein n=2 Tax=Helianthus annuus TaxID=4232 RepID=A0A9K3H083_HELAN|nr:hypothetical protein HanXRQr2_Chr16g0767231 [Helianthus annuus]KAJ0822720.1 hypothetical protein HanPSC8_Chr16g0735421 [Helianthus annuus]KAJ0944916.1 hypothetical protein HanPSC8_Chr03g0122061 [Helianthus annuus]
MRRSEPTLPLRPRMSWCPLLTSWKLTVSGCGLTALRVLSRLS